MPREDLTPFSFTRIFSNILRHLRFQPARMVAIESLDTSLIRAYRYGVWWLRLTVFLVLAGCQVPAGLPPSSRSIVRELPTSVYSNGGVAESIGALNEKIRRQEAENDELRTNLGKPLRSHTVARSSTSAQIASALLEKSRRLEEENEILRSEFMGKQKEPETSSKSK